MENNRKKNLLVMLLILNLMISAALVVYLAYNRAQTAAIFSGQQMLGTSKYTLYIGTNDSTTHTQPLSAEEAKAQVNAICEKYVEGFTVFQANGDWIDATGTKVTEDTLIYCFYNADENNIKSIMDEVLKNLHQSAILFEKADADIFYYSGTAQ